MPRVRKRHANQPDPGVQLPLPSGAEPAPARGGDPPGAPGGARPGGRPPPPEARPARPPAILQLDLHDFGVLAWVRDEDGQPVYRIVRQGINAAKITATLARKLQKEGK